MRTLRRLAPIALAIAVTAGAGPSTRALESSAFPNGLSGVARDMAGDLLSDVDILLVPASGGSGPVTRVRTDAQGRFFAANLPEGVYRVAALKSGYLATLTRVHTAVRSSIEIVLNPIPKPGEPGAERVLEDRSWVLRVPRRSLLRDVEREGLLAERPEPTVASDDPLSSIPDAVQAELMHRVAVAGLGRDGGRAPLEGTETRMQVGSFVGERANLRFEGTRQAFSSKATDGLDPRETRQQSGAFAMDLSVEAGRHSNVDVRAFYRDADLAVATGLDGLQRDAQRSWGYDATWAMQLDAASRLAVQLDYVDLSIAPDAVDVPWSGTSNRAMGAETGYEVLADDNHFIRVGFRAQRLDLALPLVRTGGERTAFLGVTGAAGWSATLDVEDSWSVGGGATVVYGLGVRQSIDEVNATLVVPRAGAAWSGRHLELRGVLSYHALPPVDGIDGEGRASLPGEIRPDEPMGYEVQVAAPLGSGWMASARFQDFPVQPAYLGLRGAASSETFYLTNGNVADRRASFQLHKPGSFGAFSLRWTDGRAEGYVADDLGWESPYQILANRELRYRSAGANLTLQRSGTGLALEWVEVTEGLPGGTSGEQPAPVSRRYLDAEFQQDLVRFGFLDARCRLVVAARLGTDADGVDGERSAALLSLQKRLSAGVSVLF